MLINPTNQMLCGEGGGGRLTMGQHQEGGTGLLEEGVRKKKKNRRRGRQVGGRTTKTRGTTAPHLTYVVNRTPSTSVT